MIIYAYSQLILYFSCAFMAITNVGGVAYNNSQYGGNLLNSQVNILKYV